MYQGPKMSAFSNVNEAFEYARKKMGGASDDADDE